MSVKRLLFGGDGGGSPVADAGLLLLRAGTGLLLAFGHGLGKLPPPRGFVDGVKAMGLPAPTLFAWMATIGEFFGGLLLALGLLTRPAAFLVACTMAVAVAGAHRSDPLFMKDAEAVRVEKVEGDQKVVVESKKGTKEPALLFLMPALALLLTGSGRYGLDALIRGRNADRLPIDPAYDAPERRP